jgi:plasmid stability protein
MAKITVTNIPDELYQSVKDRARQQKRSLSREVIVCLEAALKMKGNDASKIIARARALRKGVSGRLTDETLRALKSEGRL